MDAHLSYLLFLGPWALLAGILALAGRLLAGPRPDDGRPDVADDSADGGWPMAPLAGPVVAVALLLILRALHGPGDTMSAAVLLLVLAILLLHVARRGVLPDSDAPDVAPVSGGPTSDGSASDGPASAGAGGTLSAQRSEPEVGP